MSPISTPGPASRYLVLDSSSVGGIPSVSRRLVALILFSVFPFLIAWCCELDDTLELPIDGKGLSQHYGFWAIFVTTPLILILSSALLDRFVATVTNLDVHFVGVGPDTKAELERLVDRLVSHVSLRSLSSTLLIFLSLVFAGLGVYNVLMTINPMATYGHDVFDALKHPSGFYVTKAYVFLVFTIAWSIAVFLATSVTFSMVMVLKFVTKHRILQINVFHSDNCGGTSRFGMLNLLILALYTCLLTVPLAMFLTHKHTYLVMDMALFGCFLLLIQNVVGVYYIQRLVAQKKEECIEAANKILNAQLSDTFGGGEFAENLLAFRGHVMGMHTLPYTKSALAAVGLINLVSAAVAIVSFVKF
jgi:hypothetical protein